MPGRENSSSKDVEAEERLARSLIISLRNWSEVTDRDCGGEAKEVRETTGEPLYM